MANYVRAIALASTILFFYPRLLLPLSNKIHPFVVQFQCLVLAVVVFLVFIGGRDRAFTRYGKKSESDTISSLSDNSSSSSFILNASSDSGLINQSGEERVWTSIINNLEETDAGNSSLKASATLAPPPPPEEPSPVFQDLPEPSLVYQQEKQLRNESRNISLGGQPVEEEEKETKEESQPSEAGKQISNLVLFPRMVRKDTDTNALAHSPPKAADLTPQFTARSSSSPSSSSSSTAAETNAATDATKSIPVPQSEMKINPIPLLGQSKEEIIGNSLSDSEWQRILSEDVPAAAKAPKPPKAVATRRMPQKENSRSQMLAEKQVIAATQGPRQRRKESILMPLSGWFGEAEEKEEQLQKRQKQKDGDMVKKITRYFFSNSPMIIDMMQQFQEDFIDN